MSSPISPAQPDCGSSAPSSPASMIPRRWRACGIIGATPTPKRARKRSPETTAEHLFALEQALALYDVYHEKVLACDIRIEAVLKELSIGRGHNCDALPSPRRRTDQVNGLAFDARSALFALLGKEITRVDGFGPYLALKLVAGCGGDLLAWPSAKHFTSWLGLAPNNKISGGWLLSSRTQRTGSRPAALLRLAA